MLRSSSSMEAGKEVEISLPMKILDDLNICEIRAKLRYLSTLNTGVTVSERLGKSWWERVRGRIRGAIKLVARRYGAILYGDVMEERDVYLTFVVRRADGDYIIKLHGRIDLAAFLNYRGIPLILLFEFTLYRDAADVVKDRLVAYASGIYSEYGFPVVPVLVIIKDTETTCTVTNAYILSNEGYFIKSLSRKIADRFLPILLDEKRPKHASKDVCHSCDLSIRRMCPIYH